MGNNALSGAFPASVVHLFTHALPYIIDNALSLSDNSFDENLD